MAELSEFFVCRLSALPTALVEALRADDCARLVDDLHDIVSDLDRQCHEVADALAIAVADASSQRSRRTLIQLRRDIFNKRRLSSSRIDDVCVALDGALTQRVKYIQGLHDTIYATRQAARELYERELNGTRTRFRAAIEEPRFRFGLLLSSEALQRALQRYRTSHNTVRSREERIERGLLRYFVRSSMKATPFSTFCTILPGAITGDRRAEGLHIEGNPTSWRSVVRINKQLLPPLLAYLESRPAIRQRLIIQLNPTLERKADSLSFFAVHGNQEVFRSVAINPAITLAIDALAAAEELTLGQFIEHLMGDPEVSATKAEATEYVDGLIANDLIRFRKVVRDQDADWDIPLTHLIASADDPGVGLILQLLQSLRSGAERYARADLSARTAILEELRSAIRHCGNDLHINLHGISLPFYEDVTADAVAVLHRTSEIDAALDALTNYIALTLPIAWHSTDHASARHFLDTHYASAKQPIPLLRFAEDYFREHYKRHLEKERAALIGRFQEVGDYNITNPFGLAHVQKISNARSRLSEIVREKWRLTPTAEEIVLTREDLARVTADVPSLRTGARSASVFCQLFTSSSKGPRIVCASGHYTVGYGKYFSRFLHLFASASTELLWKENEGLTADCLAEICSDGNHNVNLHPPLLANGISYATVGTLPPQEQLEASTLAIGPDPDSPHATHLVHVPTGRRVIPIDLGFSGLFKRPPVFQLLTRLTPPMNFDLNAPLDMGMQQVRSEEAQPYERGSLRSQVVYRPRISFEGKVILTRRAWRFTEMNFPRQQPSESAADYFIRLNIWRRNNGLPAEVYVRVGLEFDSQIVGRQKAVVNAAPDQEGDQGTEGEGRSHRYDEQDSVATDQGDGDPMTNGGGELAKYSRDFIKPQYIDFRSPLLVKLFAKLPSNFRKFNVVFEERLPGTGDLPSISGSEHTAELILQVNFRESSSVARTNTDIPAKCGP